MVHRIFPAALLLGFAMAACGPQTVDRDAARSEVRQLMEDYAGYIRAGAYDSVAALYSDTGAVIGRYGQNGYLTLDSIKAIYATFPGDTAYFDWLDQRIELLGDSAALVTANFNLRTSNPLDTIDASYTGVLKKGPAGWKLIHETESPSMATLQKWFKAGVF